MKQPKTLESKTYHTFPEIGSGTFVEQLVLDLPGLIFASSFVPKVLNEEPAHTNSFILFCNGVESGFMARAYEPSSLTRNSHGTQGWPVH